MKKPKYALALKIEGPGVQAGTIPVPYLIRICQAAQDAINRQAEALRGGSSLRPGPKSNEVQEVCTLELTGIEKGSTILPFRFASVQEPLPLPGATAFGDDVIRTVVQAIEQLGNGSKKDKFEAGVLDSLKALGEVLERGRISKIEWIVPAATGKKSISATFDKRVRSRVLHEIKKPFQRSETIEGMLEMADFKEQERKCRIHPAIGQPILCVFDQKHAETIYRWLRQPVRATGLAKVNAHTGRVDELQIEDLQPAETLWKAGSDFFASRSLEELAQEQGVKPLGDSKELAGGMPADEDLGAFLEEIYNAR